jgi:hypothetical protein
MHVQAMYFEDHDVDSHNVQREVVSVFMANLKPETIKVPDTASTEVPEAYKLIRFHPIPIFQQHDLRCIRTLIYNKPTGRNTAIQNKRRASFMHLRMAYETAFHSCYQTFCSTLEGHLSVRTDTGRDHTEHSNRR